MAKVKICYLQEDRMENKAQTLDPNVYYLTTVEPNPEKHGPGSLYVKNIQSVIFTADGEGDVITIYVRK